MKSLTGIFMGLLVATVMLAFTTRTVMAQEKAKPAEQKEKAEKTKGQSASKVLFENEKDRKSVV